MIFKKIKIKNTLLNNRIVVSPMCQYSGNNGSPTEWHYRHLGDLIMSGAGSVILESTAVNKNGMITNKDLCLYNDIQEKKFYNLIKFIKKINDIPIFIQISHAGRKASSYVPWIKHNKPLPKRFSWQTYSASALKKDIGWPTPKALSRKEICQLIKDFRNTTIRSRRVGFDGIELHMAHGYLLHQFLSPISNIRNDEFGGKFENRIRLPLLICKNVRRSWPTNRLLGARITGTDHLKNGITFKESLYFAKCLEKIGFDYICVSSGGILTKTNMRFYKGFRVNMARKFKKNTNLIIRTSGNLNDLKYSSRVIKKKYLDLVAIGRTFLKNPFWIYNFFKKNNFNIEPPNPYKRGFE